MDDENKPVTYGRKKLTAPMVAGNLKEKRSSKKQSMKKRRYFPHNKPATEKNDFSLRPGVQGFFITCNVDRVRRRKASKESTTMIEMSFEDLVLKDKYLKSKSEEDLESKSEEESDSKPEEESDSKPEEESGVGDENIEVELKEKNKFKSPKKEEIETTHPHQGDTEIPTEEKSKSPELVEGFRLFRKRDPSEVVQPRQLFPNVKKQKTIDQLIEEEMDELAKNKDRFLHLHTGCKGVLFLQMLKNDGEPGPEAVVKHMVTSMASGRELKAKFMYRILPIEVACYASVEKISDAIRCLIEKYFRIENQSPIKFAVLYEARANTDIDKAAVIDVVANSVPQPHRVDLNNAETTIVVEIVKTICLIGVVENYKALSKYNVRAAY